MFKSSRQKFHEASLILKDRIEQRRVNIATGICFNLRAVHTGMDWNFNDALVGKYARSWKHFSGDELYPIVGGFLAFSNAQYEGAMWKGEYGALRKELLDHLIERSKYSDIEWIIKRIKTFFTKK
jgi:hypothetical protein